MSLLSVLRPKRGSVKKSKRLGRGNSSGQGGTAGKGHKGQKARAGGRVRRGFEGGQTPLARRLPKFGFTNAKFKTTYELFNLKDLEHVAEKLNSSDINPTLLVEAGLLQKGREIKILGEGGITKSLNVTAHKFSKMAKESIEKSGGKVEVI